MLPDFLALLHQRELARDEVDAGVTLGCPDAQPALRNLRNAACGDVGHAAVREFEASVHHVLVAAEDRRADGRHMIHRASHQREQQIEIVNHEIEDGADVGAAAGEWSVPFGFDELGTNRPLDQFLERRVEPLDVPHLKRYAGFRGQCHQFLGLGNSAAHRLLDQNRHALAKKRGGDFVMVNGGRDDADGIHAIDERGEVVEGGGAQLRGNGPRLLRVGVRDTDKLHVRHRGEDSCA